MEAEVAAAAIGAHALAEHPQKPNSQDRGPPKNKQQGQRTLIQEDTKRGRTWRVRLQRMPLERTRLRMRSMSVALSILAMGPTSAGSKSKRRCSGPLPSESMPSMLRTRSPCKSHACAQLMPAIVDQTHLLGVVVGMTS